MAITPISITVRVIACPSQNLKICVYSPSIYSLNNDCKKIVPLRIKRKTLQKSSQVFLRFRKFTTITFM